jgi:transposase
LAPSIAIVGRDELMGPHLRKDHPDHGHKSSNRSCGWVVERTFGWKSQQRRLSKDYERLCATSEAWIYLTMIRLMVRRLARF